MPRAALTQSEFVSRANTCHQNVYDYTKTVYKGSHTKLTITCPIHGDWEVLGGEHIRLSGGGPTGCPMCAGRKSQTSANSRGAIASSQEAWIAKAKVIHGETYDYSTVIYTHSLVRVQINCRLHGPFMTTPNNHLARKSGCPVCAGHLRQNQRIFTIRAKVMHGAKYDYHLVSKFTTSRDVVTIVCPKHGEFNQAIKDHLRGRGCVKCGNERSGLKQRGTKRRKMLTPTI